MWIICVSVQSLSGSPTTSSGMTIDSARNPARNGAANAFIGPTLVYTARLIVKYGYSAGRGLYILQYLFPCLGMAGS